ncbi:MAG TPA: hypothetical protein VK941_00325 [Gillisia sp.]|nr:hypothetical protein [Gillisia sp.]
MKKYLSVSPYSPQLSAVSELGLGVEKDEVNETVIPLLKKAIWGYFLLLILEGALRKWFLPGLATPLLVVRDPIAIYIIYMAWKNGILVTNFYLSAMVFIGSLSVITALLTGHGNFFVALYGARILLIHFPLIFIIGNVLKKKDVINIGKVMLWISLPMTILIALQFFSPQNAWVNIGVGGDTEGSGFNAGAQGYFRPSGTFSFTIGIVHFYNLAACFVCYFWLNPKRINRLLLIAASLSLSAAIPLSIARSLLFGVGITFIFLLFAILRKPKKLIRLIPIGIVLISSIMLLSTNSFVQLSSEAFLQRMENANQIEGGVEGVVGNRYFGGMFRALTNSADQPLFGHGSGIGTNVGSMLLTGETTFLISEGEWGRVIGEFGPVLGIAVIFLRLGICFKLLILSYRKLILKDALPWLLISYCLLIFPQGQWARPMTLGFAILIAGLVMAALKNK